MRLFPLAHYALTGDTLPVLDPSILRQGDTYYAFSTDVAGFSSTGHLPIHCSQGKENWTLCGSVFSSGIPAWILKYVHAGQGLWSPDVSYFNGQYHVYYAASILGTQQSVIGLVINTTLDASDPAYRWVDRGLVLASHPGDDFNALDPNILIDADGITKKRWGASGCSSIIEHAGISNRPAAWSGRGESLYLEKYRPAQQQAHLAAISLDASGGH